MTFRVGVFVLAAVEVALTLAGCQTEFDPAPLECTRFASPNGDDGATGSAASPFATVQKLVSTLGPGDMGCLRAGVYEERVEIDRPGPIVLRSMPGERATIRGLVYIVGDDVVVSDLDLDGEPAGEPSPRILGDRITLRNDDITNHGAPERCIVIGDYGVEAGIAPSVDVIIEGNRVHDCGPDPDVDQVGAGMIVYHAVDTIVTGNVLYDNGWYGVLLYPHSQGTVMRGNVLDGNRTGLELNSGYGVLTTDSIVEHNLVTGSTEWNVYGLNSGTNNVVDHNCIFGGGASTSDNPGGLGNQDGWTLGPDNVFLDPHYADPAAKDFRPTEPQCAALLGQ